jgi:hypothetical protein
LASLLLKQKFYKATRNGLEHPPVFFCGNFTASPFMAGLGDAAKSCLYVGTLFDNYIST